MSTTVKKEDAKHDPKHKVEAPKPEPKFEGHVWGLGRRKEAVARVQLSAGTGKVTINGEEMEKYFQTDSQRVPMGLPFACTETAGKFDVHCNVKGGGKAAQADAVMLGIARALVKVNLDFDARLKADRLLTRDPRMKERKKYGKHGARRGTQFSKR
jgi:small subunit ribosomal protein S9